MITGPEIEYLDCMMRDHVKRFFTSRGANALESVPIIWARSIDLDSVRGPAIAIPIDIACSDIPHAPWTVPFNGTKLRLWNRIPIPSPGWHPFPDADAPLWFLNGSGVAVPAWNIAPTLLGLLTLREETATDERDVHGRFVGNMSPRDSAGLLEAPIFNDSVAALVAAATGLSHDGVPALQLEDGTVRPVVLALSHDLDQLRGNDIWTQAVRLYRFLRPLSRFRPPAFRNLWYVLVNTLFPRQYYLENVVGMIEIERMLGFQSNFYFLNGSGGRFGARSGPKLIPVAAAEIPDGWEIGVHYNYDTHLDLARLEAQIDELADMTGIRCTSGRAHYLRFDSVRSWNLLSQAKVSIDESLGYPDRIGYRAGIAGPFRPFNPDTQTAHRLIEIPLVLMESTLMEQYPDDPLGAFRRLIAHLTRVGGALTLLFHPGMFFNPEIPRALGLYRKLLKIAREYGAVSRNEPWFATGSTEAA